MKKEFIKDIVNKLNNISSKEQRQEKFEQFKNALAKHVPVATVTAVAIMVAGLTGCSNGCTGCASGRIATTNPENTAISETERNPYQTGVVEPGTGWIEPATSKVEPGTEPSTEETGVQTSPETETSVVNDHYIENEFGNLWISLCDAILEKDASDLNNGDKMAIHINERLANIPDGSWYTIQVIYPRAEVENYDNRIVSQTILGKDFTIFTNGSSTIMAYNSEGVVLIDGNMGEKYCSLAFMKTTKYAGVYALKSATDVYANICDEINFYGGKFLKEDEGAHSFETDNGIVVTSKTEKGDFIDLFNSKMPVGAESCLWTLKNTLPFVEPYKSTFKKLVRENPEMGIKIYDFSQQFTLE